jgi:hypothetical protein
MDASLPTTEPTGRIISVTSATRFGARLDVSDLAFTRRGYTSSSACAQSRLAVVTYGNWLATRISQTLVNIHPGVVARRTCCIRCSRSVESRPPSAVPISRPR